MSLISLGAACRVRESIDRYNGFRVETNFFDWIMSNFSTVLFVFQNIDNPEAFLTPYHFTQRPPSSNNLTHYTANHTHLYFISLHDFPVEIPFQQYMNIFLEKYKRRLLRLKYKIENSLEPIHFIHLILVESMIPTIADIYYFVLAVQQIKESCHFYLHLLVPPEIHSKYLEINKLAICHNIRIFYMTSNPSIDSHGEQRQDLNWTDIYNHIKFHYK